MPVASVVFALAIALGLSTQRTSLSPDEIAAAIEQGQRIKEPMYVVAGEVAPGVGGIYLSGPFARVVTASAEAARKYRPFTAADVTPEMISPLLEITVPAAPPDGRHWSRPETVEHVVIRRAGDSGVVQPTKVEPYTRRWGNAMGGQMETAGLVARFAIETLPDGDLEIVLIRSNGERVVRLKARDRVHIR